jgi:hypothetical protein
MDEKTKCRLRFLVGVGYLSLVRTILDEMVIEEEIDIDEHHELTDMVNDLTKRMETHVH